LLDSNHLAWSLQTGLGWDTSAKFLLVPLVNIAPTVTTTNCQCAWTADQHAVLDSSRAQIAPDPSLQIANAWRAPQTLAPADITAQVAMVQDTAIQLACHANKVAQLVTLCPHLIAMALEQAISRVCCSPLAKL